MELSSQIAFQIAEETEAKNIADDLLGTLIGTVNKVFNTYSQRRSIISNLEKLAELDLLSSQSAIETMSLEFSQEAANATFEGVKVYKKDVMTQQGIAGTIPDMMKSANGNNLNLMVNETSRLLAENYDHTAIQQALIGTKAADHRDGILGQIASREETLARTAAKISEQVGMEKARQKDPDIIGYFWISVLDSATSLICQSLSGREFYYAKSGEKPLPAQHYNCRSSTGYISKTTGFEQQPKSFDKWAESNPKDAETAMGLERYKLYTDGNLKIQRFTDLKAQPLTLEQLKARNKKAFEKAGLDIAGGFHAISFVFLLKPLHDKIDLDSQSSDWRWFESLPIKLLEMLQPFQEES